jgi:hypothetical protein
MENGELWCALCALIEIISEGNSLILNSQFSILHSPLAALNNNLFWQNIQPKAEKNIRICTSYS